MQAMLPPRWLNLQAWLVLAACLVGGIAAWFADLTLLAVLAALQFFGALKMFRVGRAVRLLLRDEKALAGRSRPMRVLDALTALETVAGPARVARERVNQALQALQVIDTKPMGGMQRGVVGIVYGALLVVPLAAIVLGAAIMHPLGAEDRAKIESLRAAQKELRARVHEVSFEQLLSDIAEGAATGGADDKQLAAAEARIGRPLPEDLHRLYRKQNGVSRLTIAPVENLALADESDRKHLGAIAEDGTISLFDADPLAKAAPERVPLARTREWLRLGGERDSESATYLDAGAGDSARVIVCFGACTSYRSLRAWLEEVWVSAMAARRKP
jgi:hypothetical protein